MESTLYILSDPTRDDRDIQVGTMDGDAGALDAAAYYQRHTCADKIEVHEKTTKRYVGAVTA